MSVPHTATMNGTHRTPAANIGPQPNTGVEGFPTYIPAQWQAVGSLLPSDKFPQNASAPLLFQPITIRGVEFANRMWISPMCQYSSDNGQATDFHLVHLGSMAFRGWGSVMVEASAVVPEGRITPEDSGIWSDDHIPGFKRIVQFVHAAQGKIGIQLAHAGRKASTQAPWVRMKAAQSGFKGGRTASEENGGWPEGTYGPSEIPFDEKMFPFPNEASLDYIANLKTAYLAAVERCKKIGFDFIEIHGAHGYLMHEFCSPISNKRTDQYGGSFENRIRLPLEVATAVRKAWDGPLFYRISTSDEIHKIMGEEKNDQGEWAYWGLEQTTLLTQRLADIGIDLIDVSSGGNHPQQWFEVKPSYMVHYAAHIKANTTGILVGTVGMIVEPEQAADILEKGQADVVFMARQALRDIDFPLKAAAELGPAVTPAVQSMMAWGHMVVKRDACHAPKKHDGQTEVEGEEGLDAKGKAKWVSMSAGTK